MLPSDIKLCSWNCKGYRTRSEDIRLLLHREKLDILMLQETHLPSVSSLKVPGYQIYRSNPTQGNRRGGLATLVSHTIPSQAKPLHCGHQALGTFIGGTYPFTICNIYLECTEQVTEKTLETIVQNIKGPYVLAVDINAHNGLWGSVSLDKRGKAVENFIQNNNLFLHNNGQPTYMDSRTGNLDALDVVISTPSLALNSSFSISCNLYGSDHFPIFLSLFPKTTKADVLPRWSFKHANWEVFKRYLSDLKPYEDTSEKDSSRELLKYITTSIPAAADKVIPKTTQRRKRFLVPWWNDNCKEALRERRKTFRFFKKHPLPENLTKYRRARARCKFVFKQAKTLSWQNFVTFINRNTTSTDIWQKIKSISGKRSQAPLPVLKIGNDTISNPQDVAETLALHFTRVSSTETYPTNFQDKKTEEEENEIIFDLDPLDSEEYNVPFSFWELETAINSLKPTSAGQDNIHNSMLKNLTLSFKMFLLKLFNILWQINWYPESWRDAILILVLKPGKDNNLPESYRPIAMTNTLSKLYEKIINTRLMWELEKRKLLSKYQSGFRKNRSTIDNLTRLAAYIQDGFVQNKVTLGVFFDLEKIYDKTWRYIILKQLKKFGFKGNLPNFIKTFLHERKFQVKVGNALSRTQIQQNGVPQGAVLSVTLFILAINDIASVIPSIVEAFNFVDDITVLFRAKDVVTATSVLQQTLNKMSTWVAKNGFTFSGTKTRVVLFSRKRNVRQQPNLTLFGQPLQIDNEIKYLGMILDKKLSWKHHIEAVRVKCLQDLNILRAIQSYKWGADRQTLLRIYHQLVRSKLDYGCSVYGSAKENLLKRLDVVHNTALRTITGAFRTSPVDSLAVEAFEPPLYYRRNQLLLQLGFRVLQFPDNPASNQFRNPRLTHQYERKPHYPKPPGLRYTLLITQYNLAGLPTPSIQTQPDTAPWTTRQPQIKYLGNHRHKSEILDDDYIQEYRKYKSKHIGAAHFYTDGSKNNDGSGYAFVHSVTTRQYACRTESCITTIELEAMLKAIGYAIENNMERIIIFTDSKSGLQSLNKLYTSDIVVSKIRSLIHRSTIRVQFCWIPSHRGIEGNEKADALAKSAPQSGVTLTSVVTPKDLKKYIKISLRNAWQEIWKNSTNTKLKFVKPSIEDWSTSYRPNRREVILTRLRIGHSRLTHRYLIKTHQHVVGAGKF